ncbi:helix-turn-helix domain-containing protein [Micromonospora sp. NPDC047738]|uniref:helix-turn-helix domain-containing protein n=1 Tax=Micromonospora sp. NPDC047738 TaxID=3155741 RepID=UPI003411C4FF
MSIEAVSWALSYAPDVPPQCLAVLIGLANHADAAGRAAFPSQERLAHYARKTVRSVRRDLDELERLGLIRRGDQRHTAFLPADRRPVVWDLATHRRRPLPASLDPYAEPHPGRPTDVHEPVDNRHEPVDNREDVHVPPVIHRPDAHVQTAGRTRPNDRTHTSDEPSLTIHNQKRARPRGGIAAPADVRSRQCPQHRGSPAHNCGPCRAERLGRGANDGPSRDQRATVDELRPAAAPSAAPYDRRRPAGPRTKVVDRPAASPALHRRHRDHDVGDGLTRRGARKVATLCPAAAHAAKEPLFLHVEALHRACVVGADRLLPAHPGTGRTSTAVAATAVHGSPLNSPLHRAGRPLQLIADPSTRGQKRHPRPVGRGPQGAVPMGPSVPDQLGRADFPVSAGGAGPAHRGTAPLTRFTTLRRWVLA